MSLLKGLIIFSNLIFNFSIFESKTASDWPNQPISSCITFILGILENSLPNDKTLDWSKFEAFAEDNRNVTRKLKFLFGKGV